MDSCETKLKRTATGTRHVLFAWLLCGYSLAVAQPMTPNSARVTTEYALISTHDYELDDPKDWRLLGSNDDGRSWTLLDVQTNRMFAGRSQRRAFAIKNKAAYNIYRLQVDASRGSTNSALPIRVSLAELELIGPVVGVPSGVDLQAIITSSREHPLKGPSAQAFDHDPTTAWADFGLSDAKGCWLQCQYTLHSELLVTNISQLRILARQMATRNPFYDKAPQILSNLTAQATKPIRALTGYALTSANDAPDRDPRDWRLLGSNDGGKTWDTLDARSNEIFATRFQRRAFTLANRAFCALYRLQIDSVAVPAIADSVQLAEIEPLYAGKDADTRLSLVVTAQGENAPVESVEMLFDGETRTKWLDFSHGKANRASWIQWQYSTAEELPVINLDRLRAARRRESQSMKLQLAGVVVSVSSNSRMVGFLDETGFQLFDLNSSVGEVRPGDRVRLSGRPQLGKEPVSVLDPEVVSSGALSAVSEVNTEQPFNEDQHFLLSAAEGKVTSVSQAQSYSTIRLSTENGSGRLLANLFNPEHAPIPSFADCRLRVQGVVEPVFTESGKRVAGVIWVANLGDVALAAPTEKEWSEWPEYSVQSLSEPNVYWGRFLRVRGTVVQQNPGQSVVIRQGTNQLIAYFKQTVSLPANSVVEAVGFFAKEGRMPILRWAYCRPAIEKLLAALAKEPILIDERNPVSEIRQIHELIKSQPGREFPLKVRGVLTYIDLGLDLFYLQDGTESIVASGQLSAGLHPFLQQEGTYVELQGRVQEGSVFPTAFVTVLGRGRMPEPLRHSWDYLMTGKDDGRWVEVEGVVSAFEGQPLTLIVQGKELIVWINKIDKSAQSRPLGSRVRICGVCSPVLNGRGQRLGIRLLVPSSEYIEVLNPAPENPFDMPTLPLRRVMQSDLESSALTVQFVKTAGVLTHKGPHLLFVQDGGDGLRVFPRKNADVEPGDRVEVVGLAEPDGFSPKLVQALVRKVGRASLPSANPINLLGIDSDSQESSQDATRGQIEATFLGQSFKESVQILELQDNKRKITFYAFLPASNDVLLPVPVGSLVRLQGVFKAKTDTVPDFGKVITSFEMYLNSAEDILILERPPWWTLRHTLWVLGGLGAVLMVWLGWAGSLRKQVRHGTRELHGEIDEHKRTETKLEAEIVERKRMEIQVQKTHQELLATSRQAGMAEVATSVLHNVGNVLNSVNVSSTLMAENLKKSRASNLPKVAALMNEHSADLGTFIATDPKGQYLSRYLCDEDALHMNAGALARHEIQLVREYSPHLPEISVEKHKVLQILVNLLRNAKHACDESDRTDKRLTVRVVYGDGRVKISVIDNGIGIPQENLIHIFNHGFTTRKDGHGFGLHSGANAAREMGGSLTVHSDGPGQGAMFTLELPMSLPIRDQTTSVNEIRLGA